MNGTTNLSISQLRQMAAKAIQSVVSTKQPTIIFQRSQPKAVLVDYDYFQALEEAVLDASDAQESERAKKEDRIPLADYLKKRWGRSPI